jgi:hypothetical protein
MPSKDIEKISLFVRKHVPFLFLIFGANFYQSIQKDSAIPSTLRFSCSHMKANHHLYFEERASHLLHQTVAHRSTDFGLNWEPKYKIKNPFLRQQFSQSSIRKWRCDKKKKRKEEEEEEEEEEGIYVCTQGIQSDREVQPATLPQCNLNEEVERENVNTNLHKMLCAFNIYLRLANRDRVY